MVLSTSDQKDEYIIHILDFYQRGAQVSPNLEELENKLYFNVPAQREPTVEVENPIYKAIEQGIKKIFIKDLLFKILNPGQRSNYNRFAVELGYLDENFEPI